MPGAVAGARELRPGFVGRGPEIAALCRALDDALGRRGRLVFLVGEPGIGKTRTAEELSRHAEERGTSVVWGRCHEGGSAPAYWPWVQIVRALVRGGGEQAARRWLGNRAPVLTQVIGEALEVVAHPSAPAAPPLDADAARFRFFDAFVSFLERAAADRPLVLLLDDLHWADHASLLLLEFLARHVGGAPIFVLGTYRDVELRQATDDRIRGGLARLGERIDLLGLVDEDVRRLVSVVLGEEPPTGFTERVLRLTEGNPFFVEAFVRLLAAQRKPGGSPGGLDAVGVPDDVRDTIRQRFRSLPADALSILSTAAVIGREFSVSVLAEALERPEATVVAALDAAEALRLVEPPLGGGRRRFAHALIREALMADLPRTERAALHRRVAETLETRVGTDRASIDALAEHFVAAGVDEKAVRYCSRAGEVALARFAYEDAARHYRRALEVLGDSGAAAERCELLLALGDAERRAGETPAARATFRAAAESARTANMAEHLARAAFGHGAGFGAFWDHEAGTVDRERVVLLRDALQALGPEDSGWRALLLSRLSMALLFSMAPEERALVEPLAREARAMAQRLDDPRVTGAVLASWHLACWRPDNAAERVATAAAVVRMAAEVGQVELAQQGRVYRAVDLLEIGDVGSADREMAAFLQLAIEVDQPRYRWCAHVWAAMRAHLEGRFDEAERNAEEARRIGETTHPEAARHAFTAHLLTRAQRGEREPLLRAFQAMAEEFPAVPVWRCVYMDCLAEQGDLEGARAQFERLAAHDFADVPFDFNWIYTMGALARVAYLLDDAPRATILYERLRPYEDRTVIALYGCLCEGFTGRALGLAAATLGRWDAAVQHFEDAIARNSRLGAWTFVTVTQHEYASALLRRGAARDERRALELLSAAEAGARRLGQVSLLGKIAMCRGRTATVAPPLAEDACALRRGEADWVVAHAGTTFHLKDTLGVGYLLVLLRHPGREFHALDLVAGHDPEGARRPAGDAGEMLDERARVAYRRRLAELREELEEAQAFNDIGRAEHAAAEIDALTDELGRAVGLGRRARRAGSDAERARLNVTRAVRKVIARIAEQDPALGDHLERSVETGLFCGYKPDPRLLVRWEL